MNRIVAASALALTLALPAAASAHPGVYTVTQKVANGSETYTQDPTGANLTNRTQYNVANDGWARSFTEDNGLTVGPGMINYKAMPSSWRVPMTADQKRTFANAQTGLQAHATCTGIGLEDGAEILSWQEDPFFNYVPFQLTSAGVGDEPSKWIGVVKSATGVDLTGMTDAQAQTACTGKGGTYRKADTGASITDAQIAAANAAATAPLQSQITTLQTGLSTVTAQFTAAETARKALVARPLTFTLSGKKTPNIAMITGAAGTAVTVKMTISGADAKKLKLASRTLATKTKTLDSQGAGLVTLTPSAKARKAIKKAVKVTLEAAGGSTTKTASGTYLD